MPVIVRVPDADCAGCKWALVEVGQLNLSTEAFDGLFNGPVFIHESERVYTLQHRNQHCPIHGDRGYK